MIATVSTQRFPSSTRRLVNFSALKSLAFVNSASVSKSYFFFTHSSDSYFNFATFDFTIIIYEQPEFKSFIFVDN